MKAIRRTIPCMALGAAAALLSACVGPAQPPARAPAPVPPPARSLPPQPVPPPLADWHDLPATPGVWQWRREGSLSIARFGNPPQPALFSLTCDQQAGTITLTRSAVTGPAATIAILTTSLSRTLSIPPGAVGGVLSARDSLLDAIAFSRGRFGVEVPGLATLTLPSWPEVSRVIEDCRAPFARAQ